MKKSWLFSSLGILLLSNCEAFCPLCIFTAGAGVGLTQYLGIDDLITGVWLGASTISFVAMTTNWKKIKNIKGIELWIGMLYYGALGYFLQNQGLIGHELNQLWGVDRLILGIITGSIVFYGTHWWYLKLKQHNNGRPYFPYQKVVMPLVGLIILSLTGLFI